MIKKIKFEVSDVHVTDEIESSQFATLSVDVFASGNNAHNLPVSEETLKKTSSTIKEKPFVWMFDLITNDAGSHDPLEVPCGFVPFDSDITYRRLDDGRLMMNVTGKIWKKYSGKLIEIFNRDDNKKPVSVEMEVIDAVDIGDGKTELLDWEYVGITILGTGITPAIAGAGADLISFASSEKKEYEGVYVKEFGDITNFPNEGSNEEISMENSNFVQFDFEYAKELKADYPDIWGMGGKIGGSDSFNAWEKLIVGENFDGVSEWLCEREIWAKGHKYNKTLAEVIASVKWGHVVHKGESYMKKIIDGKKEEITSYFSEKNKEESSMTKKNKEFALNSKQVIDLLSTELADFKYNQGDYDYRKYWVRSFDEDFVYVCDWEDDKTYRMPYVISDGACEVSVKEKEEVIEAGYMTVEEATAQFSLDAYADVAAGLAFLEKETEQIKEIASMETFESVGKFVGLLIDKIQEMAKEEEDEKEKEEMAKEDKEKEDKEMVKEDKEEEDKDKEEMAKGGKKDEDVYMSEKEAEELKELREFKEAIDKENFNSQIEETLEEVKEIVSKKELSEMKESSEDFSLEDIDVWKNSVKAKAFTVASNKEEVKPEDKIKKIGLPFDDVKKSKDGLWE